MVNDAQNHGKKQQVHFVFDRRDLDQLKGFCFGEKQQIRYQ